MTSEIRTNTLTSRAGLSTVTLTDSGPMFSGITTFVDNSGFTFGVGAGSSIFTPASNTLTFGTNSAERFRIDPNGHITIGIGASSLSNSYLTIPRFSGDGDTIRLISQRSDTAPADLSFVKSRSTTYGSYGGAQNNDFIMAINSYIDTGSALNYRGSYRSLYDTSTNGVHFTWSSGISVTEKMRLSGSGYLGIGTDNPQKKLEVFDATQGVIRIRGGAGGSNSSRKADLSLFASGAREYVVRADASDAAFKIVDVSGSNAERFTILSNGRVGINTSTTNRQLMINDESGGGIGVQGSNAGIYMGTHATNGFQSNCAIARAGASNYHISGSSVGDFCIAGESTKDIIFGTSVNAGAMAERLRITHDGNIGIGNRTSSPDQLLHVHTSSGDAVIHVEAGADPKLRLRAHSGESIIQFADGSSSNTGEINYVHSEDYLKFRVNGSERLRINNAGITTFYKVPELDTTPTSGHNSTAGTFGFAVQRSFVRNVTAGNVANFCDYYATEGNMALMIQISSDTGGNSGTATYFWYGGFLPSSGYGDHWHRIFPAHVGYGHGNAADNGIGNASAWELLIGGAGVTGNSYRIRVACHVPSGKVNKNIVCTITELRRGMQFYNKSSDALYSFSGQTDSGSDGINQTWAANFTVTNDQDSTTYNYREIYLSGNQHLYFNNGNNQAYLHLNGSWQNASDLAYKKDIEDITYGIDTVKQLKPRKYKHKGTNDDDIGFIAQELETVIPEIVGGDEGSKGVSYGNLTAVLTKAIQELTTKIETLEQENITLRERVTNLEGN